MSIAESKMDEAAARLGYCGPACALETHSDATDDWGDRKIVAYCAAHGLRSASFRPAPRPVGR